jgi:hypothetical protein
MSLLVLLLVLAAADPLSGQPPRPTPCSSPEHRQFDFWVGEWDVASVDRQVTGRDTITREHGGCVVVERFTGAGGFTGSSYNVYEPATRRWHQIWVDSSGTLLQLSGGLQGAAMVLEGPVPNAGGTSTHHQLRIEPLADGRVRHQWRTTNDGGKTWRYVFDGTLVRRD